MVAGETMTIGMDHGLEVDIVDTPHEGEDSVLEAPLDEVFGTPIPTGEVGVVAEAVIITGETKGGRGEGRPPTGAWAPLLDLILI